MMNRISTTRSNFLLLLFFVLPLLSLDLYSQVTITGKVTDSSDGAPLIGATVSIKGTTRGTITDIDGNFTIRADSQNDVLLFTSMGYEPVEETIGNRSVINVSMGMELKRLDEIVVIGYGTQKKEDLTGAVSVVTAQDLKKANVTSVASAMQGRAAGVSITSTSGMPGADMNIRIRGVGSIREDAQPIVVVDGVVTGTGVLNTLNPQDIESISILKDASSTAIYGSRASNGVILVQTKRGQSGEPTVSFSAQGGFASLPRKMEMLNADEYVNYYKSAYDAYNARFPNSPPRRFPVAYTDEARAKTNFADTDWQSLISRDRAWQQNYYMSVSGGNEKANYMLSGNYLDNKGLRINTGEKLYTIKINSDLKVGKRIRVGESITFTKRDRDLEGTTTGSPWIAAAVASPLMYPYEPKNKGGYAGPIDSITGPNDRTNPYGELMMNERYFTSNSFFSSIYGEVDLFKGLIFRTNLGLSYFNENETNWQPRYDMSQRSNTKARLGERVTMGRSITWDQQLIYSKTLFNNHNIGATFVHTMEDHPSVTINGAAAGFDYEYLRILSMGDPKETGASQSLGITRRESFLGRVNYDYRGRYLATFSLRQDISTRFAPGYRKGIFPSFSMGWKMNEDLLPNVDWINMLKLRGGWGATGNEPGFAFAYDPTISVGNELVYSLGEPAKAIFGVAPFYKMASPSLRWESAEMTNIGIDFVAFRNKLEMSVEFYNKINNNLIVDYKVSNFFGMTGDIGTSGPPLVNLGEVLNRGLDFSIIYKKREGVFQYTVTGNLTTIKNKVLYIPNPDIRDYNVAVIGHTIGSFYGYVAERILQESDFVTDENGRAIVDADGKYNILHASQFTFTAPGDIKFKDLNGDGVINPLDRTIIGKPVPDFTYGLVFDCSYKGWDMNIFFQGMHNYQVYNGFRSRSGNPTGDFTTKDENKLKEVLGYWTPENKSTEFTRIGISDENKNTDNISSWWLEDASFLRLKSFQLGYTIPSTITSRANMSNTRVYIGGANLLTFTKYRGYDPEVTSKSPINTNVDNGSYPVPRLVTFGISTNF